jgi:trans-aconitate 2-methyltransferase
MWNPDIYLRFAEERGRPFHELVSRIKADEPRTVVDLGCGPGNLTNTLIQRWPGARVVGIDSSPEMIDKAVAGSAVEYRVGDISDYRPTGEVDVIITNAALQWVPGHAQLLGRWATDLHPGAWIGLQVPGNHQAPAHQALRALCGTPRWSDRLGSFSEHVRSGYTAVEYARLLREAGCDVDAWETTYVHQLPTTGGPHPVLSWLTGTALRPIRAALVGPDGDEQDWQDYCDELEPQLAAAYPAHGGMVDFEFRRIFCVAVKR